MRYVNPDSILDQLRYDYTEPDLEFQGESYYSYETVKRAIESADGKELLSTAQLICAVAEALVKESKDKQYRSEGIPAAIHDAYCLEHERKKEGRDEG